MWHCQMPVAIGTSATKSASDCTQEWHCHALLFLRIIGKCSNNVNGPSLSHAIIYPFSIEIELKFHRKDNKLL